MRKILITTNVMFLGIIIFMSCNKTDLASTGKTGQTESRTECPECFDHSTTPFDGINAETALQISNNYKQINQPLLIIDETIPDANSIWFSLESLKNFIWKIEEAACRRNCNNNLKLGLRLYYARYPETMSPLFPTLDPDFAQHHTLFMVPTFQDQLNPQTHWDFDPWHWGSDNCTPKTMKQWFASGPRPFGDAKSLVFSIGETQYFRNPDGTLSPAMNHGDLIPPYPEEGTGY